MEEEMMGDVEIKFTQDKCPTVQADAIDKMFQPYIRQEQEKPQSKPDWTKLSLSIDEMTKAMKQLSEVVLESSVALLKAFDSIGQGMLHQLDAIRRTEIEKGNMWQRFLEVFPFLLGRQKAKRKT
jgi:hypothetical protein